MWGVSRRHRVLVRRAVREQPAAQGNTVPLIKTHAYSLPSCCGKERETVSLFPSNRAAAIAFSFFESGFLAPLGVEHGLPLQ